MRVRTTWMRPYKPATEGTIANGLICYRKRGFIQAYDKTMQANKIIQHEHYLFLDLWFVKLQIYWLGKHTKVNDLAKKDEV